MSMSVAPPLNLRKWTCAEYHHAVESGVFGPDERLERKGPSGWLNRNSGLDAGQGRCAPQSSDVYLDAPGPVFIHYRFARHAAQLSATSRSVQSKCGIVSAPAAPRIRQKRIVVPKSARPTTELRIAAGNRKCQ